MAVGQLDDHFAIDLAIAAGKTLHIVHGRVSRREPLTIKQHTFEYPIIDVAIGDFLLEDGYQLELAALADDGAVHIIDAGIGMTLMQQPVLSGLQASHASRTVSTPRLTTVNLSSLPTDDLLILDPPSRQAQILVTSVRGAAATEVESHPWLAALGAEYAPVAALPMRLSVDALSDLVLLGDGPNPLSFAITAPLHTFTVNDPDFVSDLDHVFDRPDPLGRQLRNVDHPVFAGQDLDERAEAHDAYDRTVVQLADLGLGDQRLNPFLRGIQRLGVVRCDGDRAVVFDVDLGSGFLLELEGLIDFLVVDNPLGL